MWSQTVFNERLHTWLQKDGANTFKVGFHFANKNGGCSWRQTAAAVYSHIVLTKEPNMAAAATEKKTTRLQSKQR